MSDNNTPPDPPVLALVEDINAVSEKRDDTKVVVRRGRDASGKLVKGHKALPNAGRPVECAIKARKTLVNTKAWTTTIPGIVDGSIIANPGQVEMIKILLDRGYGKVADVQTMIHLMAASAPEEKSGLRALSVAELTSLARTFQLPVTAPALPAPSSEIVDAEFEPSGE